MKKINVILQFLLIIIFLPEFLKASESNVNGFESDSLENLLNIKVYSSSKYEQQINEAPSSITIISSEDIENYKYETIAEALNSIRGTYLRNDLNYHYLGVRGLQRLYTYGTNILFLLNGHIMNDNYYGSGFIGYDFGLDMKMIDRIEISRGPATAIYGAGAIMGVVNIITKKSPLIDGTLFNFKTGSYSHYGAGTVYGNEISEDFNLTASFNYGKYKGADFYFKEFDSVNTLNGKSSGLDFGEYYNGFLTLGSENISLELFTTFRGKGIPTSQWETVFGNNLSKTEDIRSFAEFKYKNEIFPYVFMQARFFYDSYIYTGDYPYYSDEEISSEIILQRDKNNCKWFGTEINLLWKTADDNNLSLNIEARHSTDASYELWNPDTVYFNHNLPYTVFSAYVQDQFDLTDFISIASGIRYDYYTTNLSAFTPRAGVMFYPTDRFNVKFFYSQAYRAPNIYEIDYGDEYVRGNAKLLPEKINMYELTGNYLHSRIFQFAFSAYYFKLSDLIDEKEVPEFEYNVMDNIGNVEGYGFEFEVTNRFSSSFRSYINYSFQKVTDLYSNQELTNYPQHIFKAGITKTLLDELQLSCEIYSELSRLNRDYSKTSPYSLVNISADYEYEFDKISNTGIFRSIGVNLKINNLLDTEYFHPAPATFRQISLVQYGRNFITNFYVRL